MRRVLMGVLAGLGLCSGATAASAEPVTTRVETRAFYGATITLEEGVRVYRPLPRHDRVIINPGGQTPVSLNFSEARSTSFNDFAGGPPPVIGSYGPSYYGGYGNVLPRRHHHGRGQGSGGNRFIPRR